MNVGLVFVVFSSCFFGTALSARGHTRGQHFVTTFLYNHGKQEHKASKNYLFLSPEADGYALVEMSAVSGTPGWHRNVSLTQGVVATVVVPDDSELKNAMAIEKKGIRITSNVDVAVYAMNDDQDSSSADANLVFPVEALSKEYLIPSLDINPSFAIVAVQPNTQVTIDLKTTCTLTYQGRTLNGNQRLVEHLDELDVFQLHSLYSIDNTCDLTGTDIISNNPVAVFAGSMCYATDVVDCEHMVEQVTPLELLGMRFIIPDLADLGDYKVRLVAAHDSTHLFLQEHHKDFSVHQYQRDMDKGDSLYLTIPDKTVLEIFSNRGASVTQFDGGKTPFSMPIPAVGNYGWNYTFSTMDNPTTKYFINYINIVCHAESADTLTVDGSPVPHNLWHRVRDLGYSVATMLIQPGTHTVISDKTFMLQVYGYSGSASYGFQAGYYLPDLPSAHIFQSTTVSPTGSGSEPCEDGKGVNCQGLQTSIGICNMPDSTSHFCRKFCGHCQSVVG